MDCIFCKIVTRELPAEVVYEDEKVLAFLDIFPTNYGHTLVIPKLHVESLNEVDENSLHAVMSVAQKIGRAVIDSLGVAGFNVIINTGAVAGQVVPHFHVHVIPRRKDDGFHHWHGPEYAHDAQKKEYAEKIRTQLQGG